MATSKELEQKQQRYKNSLVNVKYTAYELKSSIDSLEAIIQAHGNAYVLDDVKGGTNYIRHLLDAEKTTYSDIVNTIIPGIQSKINGLSYKITDAKQKEALEKDGA